MEQIDLKDRGCGIPIRAPPTPLKIGLLHCKYPFSPITLSSSVVYNRSNRLRVRAFVLFFFISQQRFQQSLLFLLWLKTLSTTTQKRLILIDTLPLSLVCGGNIRVCQMVLKYELSATNLILGKIAKNIILAIFDSANFIFDEFWVTWNVQICLLANFKE